MSGANNIPLGARPPGGGTTFGKGELSKHTAFLIIFLSSFVSKKIVTVMTGTGGGGGGGSSLLNPSYLSGGGGGGPPPKRPNMDLIAKLNSKMGHNPGTAPPPMVAPGMMGGGGNTGNILTTCLYKM